MNDPSPYEQDAWRELQRFRGRPLSRSFAGAGDQARVALESLGQRVDRALEKRPRAKAAVDRGKSAVADGGRLAARAGAKVVEVFPDEMTDWTGSAFVAAQRTGARLARIGLTAKSVVKRHQARGHEVRSLADVRRLDLEQVDDVRSRGHEWYFPALAAASGAGAGFVMSGSQIIVAASAGASAGPSGAAVAGAFVVDATAVLALSSRAVGQVALSYGYDPEQPGEKLFVLSVVNAGTAASAATKTAAFSDVAKLTRALVRGKTWEQLNSSVVSRVSQRFALMFGDKLTKKGLGKVIPAAGVVLGGVFNWATLEGIVDAADHAYRRRFLLEKYPQLEDAESTGLEIVLDEETDDSSDRGISVLDELAEEGGPDLR